MSHRSILPFIPFTIIILLFSINQLRPSSTVTLYTAIFISLLFILTLHILSILPRFNYRPPQPRKRGTPTRILIVLGSGGHTAEMFSLLRNLDPNTYTHRSYIVSSGDDFSVQKAISFEQSLQLKTVTKNQAPSPSPSPPPSNYDITIIARARHIHQSILTTPLTSLRCLFDSISALTAPSPSPSPSPQTPPSSAPPLHQSHPPPNYPDLILTNGPATGLILVLAALALRLLYLPGTRHALRCIYVESWARTRRLSLSGRVLVGIGACERVLVQWRALVGEEKEGGGVGGNGGIGGRGGKGGKGNRKEKGVEFRGALVA